MNRKDIAIIALCVLLLVSCITIYMYANGASEAEKRADALTVQNVQLTKDARADVSDAFMAGIITCTNEDIAFLNDVANEYDNTAFGTVISDWAETWAYDGDTLRSMVEDYMEEDYK